MAHIRHSVEALTGYVPGEQPSDPGIVKLNTNENPYPPSPRVHEVLAAFDPLSLRLYPDPVSLALRAAAGTLHGCGPSRVFAGNGSDEVLALCTRAYVENDGVIGYFDPSYSLYPVLARIRDVAARPQPLGDGFAWRTPGTRGMALFFLANPNAPTGRLYPKAEVRDFCERFEGVVVIDEAYVDFSREDCMDLALDLENVLVLRTLSKAYSLAGLRVGYAVGSETLIGALYKIKDSYNQDALSQRLAVAALGDREHMRANAAKIRSTRERLGAALQGIGFEVCPSDANFLWVRPPRRDAAATFEELRKRRILVRYFPGPLTGRHLRITIGTDAEVDRLIDALREAG